MTHIRDYSFDRDVLVIMHQVENGKTLELFRVVPGEYITFHNKLALYVGPSQTMNPPGTVPPQHYQVYSNFKTSKTVAESLGNWTTPYIEKS